MAAYQFDVTDFQNLQSQISSEWLVNILLNKMTVEQLTQVFERIVPQEKVTMLIRLAQNPNFSFDTFFNAAFQTNPSVVTSIFNKLSLTTKQKLFNELPLNDQKEIVRKTMAANENLTEYIVELFKAFSDEEKLNLFSSINWEKVLDDDFDLAATLLQALDAFQISKLISKCEDIKEARKDAAVQEASKKITEILRDLYTSFDIEEVEVRDTKGGIPIKKKVIFDGSTTDIQPIEEVK